MAQPNLPGPALGAYPIGSTAIYGSGHDIDYIVLVGNQAEWAIDAARQGWRYDASYSSPEADFTSLRLGMDNLVVTDKPWVFNAYLVATDIMKLLSTVVPQSRKDKRVQMYELVKQWHKDAA